MTRILQMVLFFFIFVFVSCKKENPNQPPIADTGPVQILILLVDSTELHGVGIDRYERIASYEWRKISRTVQQNTLENVDGRQWPIQETDFEK